MFIHLGIIRKEMLRVGMHARFIYCSKLEPGTSRRAWHTVGFQYTCAYLSFSPFVHSFTRLPLYMFVPSLPFCHPPYRLPSQSCWPHEVE